MHHVHHGVGLAEQLERLGNTAMTTAIAASVSGSPVAEGELRHVFIDAETKAKKGIPDEVRARLQPYVAAAEEAAAGMTPDR